MGEPQDERLFRPMHGEAEHRVEYLFRTYSTRILHYALYRGASLSDAEDIVSEVFLVSLRRLEEIRGDPLPWLLSVARGALSNQRRSRWRREALLARARDELASSPGSGEPTEWSTNERLADVLTALAQLSEHDQEILLLVAWDGLTPRQAARSTGCRSATFRVRFHRARSRLLKRLDAIRPDMREAETHANDAVEAL